MRFVRRGSTYLVAALVLYGAAFLVIGSFKDRWAWGWIERRFHQVWPKGRISRLGFSVDPWGVVLRGLEARGRDAAGGTIDLEGGFFLCNWREAVVSLRRLSWKDRVAEDARAFVFFRKGTAAHAAAFIGRLSFGKAEVSGLSLRARVTKEGGVLDALVCRVFGGEVRATGSAVWSSQGLSSYNVTAIVTRVDVEKVLHAMAPEAKFDLSGTYSGTVSLVFEEGELKTVEGVLLSDSGGRMIMTDTSVFQGVNTTPGANLVVENLKDYHYDKGDVTLGLEGSDIKLSIELAGAGGNRQLTVVFHGEEHDQP